MANSDFWRGLAISFQSVANLYEFAAHRLYYMELNVIEPTWNLPAPPAARAEFDALARRGASMLSPSPTGDLALAWLEALWREATHGPVRTPSEIVGKDRSGRLTQLHGKIDRVFQASSALCRKIESVALQSEFEEKRRDDPRNWTPFCQQYEAFKSMKEIINEPAERISEEWVRNAIARIHGIRPEDVTRKQIAFEVGGLFSSTKRHIEMIPSAPQESPPGSDPPEVGDQWVFVVIDADTKLIPAFHVGKRHLEDTRTFLWDLYTRIEGRTQITTDGLNHYRAGVPETFGLDVDFAQLVKMFGDFGQGPDARYSPAKITEVISKVRSGNPDPDHISTSFVERQNLTMRMAIRRFTRLTNAFSKKLLNLKAAVALHFAYYNFCRVHSSLRVTPAMEAGLTDHVWTIGELLSPSV